MMYYKGNFYEDRKRELPERKGWLVGQFMDGARKTDAMEIKFWQFKKGEPTEHASKRQTSAAECTLLLKGRLKARIGSDEFVFSAGEYVVMPCGIESNLALEALEDSEGITIKAPSVLGDTIKLAQ